MLSTDSIKKLLSGASPEEFKPLVQLLKATKAPNGVILEISDGLWYSQALYLGSYGKYLIDNVISINHLLLLTDYCINDKIFNGPLIIFEFLEQYNPNYQIGKPNLYGSIPFQQLLTYTPISEIKERHNWHLKARILQKSNKISYRNSSRTGKYFKIIVIDDANMMAEIIFFEDKADELFERIEEGKLYRISNGMVNKPHPNYKTEGVILEIRATKFTDVIEIEEDNTVPQKRQKTCENINSNKTNQSDMMKSQPSLLIIPISDIKEQKIWDIKIRVLEKTLIKVYNHENSSGKYFKIIVIDASNTLAEIVFFANQADEYFNIIQESKVFRVSNGTVNDPHPTYKKEGVSYEIRVNKLTVVAECEDDDSIPKEHIVNKDSRKRHEKEFSLRLDEISELSINELNQDHNHRNPENLEILTIDQIQFIEHDLKEPFKFRFNLLCYIGKLNFSSNESLWYQGCINDKCTKKVNMVEADKFFCYGCKTTYPRYKYRYRILLPLHDSTGTIMVKIFDKNAEKILGMPAESLQVIKEINEQKAFSILLKIFGQKVVANVQISFEEEMKDFVLLGIEPAIVSIKSLIADIRYIEKLIDAN